MSVVHNHPHPLAMTVVTPTNREIFKKFGKVRIEDWDDRVAGETWQQRFVRGNARSVNSYIIDKTDLGTPQNTVNEVVRCHTLTTGELVLLHDDWLPQS